MVYVEIIDPSKSYCDNKVITIHDGIAVDFAMNTVCAAGTGSFLDHQALRLNIDIEDFGQRPPRAGTR